MATREQIMLALLARLKAAYAFTLVGRRNVQPDTIAKPGQPALFLLKQHEFIENKTDVGGMLKQTLHVVAICYFDASADVNLVPDSIINDMTDAVVMSLRAVDDPMTGRLTLGGLCHSVKISGQITNAPGDQTGKGIAIIPIEIVMP